MKRNRLCALLALAVVLSLTACGGKDTPGSASGNGTQSNPPSQSGQPGQSTQPSGGVNVEAYVFRTGEATVAVNDDMADVLSALGEPQSYFEAESCAFEGLDKTYTYSGFVITTRPDGEKAHRRQRNHPRRALHRL